MSTINKLRLWLLTIMTMVTASAFGQTLVLNTNSITVNSNAQDKTFTITSDQAWTVTSSETWLTVTANASGTGNATVTLHADENPSADDRIATVTVTTGTLTETLTFTQLGKAIYLIVSTNNMVFSSAANSQSFTINANTSWTVASSQSWLTVSPASGNNDGSITVTAAENTTGSDRTATITVTRSGGSETITVIQKKPGPYLSISTTSMSFSSDGNTQSISVGSNTSWTVAVTGGDGWLTVSPKSGSNDGTISVTTAKNSTTNDRTATITVTWKDATNTTRTEVVQVKQAAPGSYLSISTTSMSFSSDGNTQSISVGSNTSWTVAVTGGDGWLTVSPMSGSNDGTISVTASKNENSSARAATITVTWKDATNTTRTESVQVKQAAPGPYLSISTTSMSFSSDGNTQSFSVGSNTSWTVAVTGGDGWLTVSPKSGSNDGTISVTAAKNSTTDERTATITVTWKDATNTTRTESVQVKQAAPGPYLSISTTSMSFSSDGNTQSFSVGSNTSWTVAVTGGDGWLTVSPKSGSNDGTISVTAAKNSTTNERTATITVTWKDATNTTRTESVQVKQAAPGPYLSISTTSMSFSSDGNTQSFSVGSNTSWTVAVTGGDGWLTVSPKSGSNNGTISVTAAKNSTTDERTATITVTWKDATNTTRTESVQVKQAVPGPYLSISTTSMSFSSDGNTQSISVGSNTSWTVAVTGGDGWLTVSPKSGSNDGTISVTAAKNSTTNERTATITVTWKDATNTTRTEAVQVKQAAPGPYLSISTTSMSFSSDGNTQSISVGSNTSWTVAVTGGDGWLTVSPMSGSNDGTISVTTAKNSTTNDRTATITVTWKDATNTTRTESVQVKQAAPGSYLSISTTSMSFSSDGNTQSISVGSNTSWTVAVTGGDGWLTVSPMSGSNDGTISVTTAKNSTTNDRTATITVTWKDATNTTRTESVQVKQAAPGSYLSISTTSMSFSSDGNTQSISVGSNTSWTVAVTGGDGWLTVSPMSGSNDGTISVTASKNENSSARTATITVSWTDGSGTARTETVKVSQAVPGPYLSISTTSMSFSSDGNTQSISVGSNTSWTVAVTGGDGWLTVSPMSGSNDGTISVTASKNENSSARTATITVSWTDGSGTARTETVKVSQAVPGPYLSISTTSMSFSSDGNTQSISVGSNTSWTVAVTGGDGWLTVSPMSGSNDGTISVTASKNENSSARTATITVSWTDGSGTARTETVKVSQAAPGPYLSISTTSMSFSSDGNTQSISVGSNTSWTVAVTCGDGWLTVSPMSGSNDGTISVTAGKNETTSERTATITIEWIDGSNISRAEVVKVKQAAPGPYLSVSTNRMTFSASGNTQSITVGSNTSWTVEVTGGDGWLTVAPMSGSNDGMVSVTAKENTSEKERSATITIVWTDGGNTTRYEKIEITQNKQGDHLSVGNNTIQFSAAGNELEFTIASNTSWTLSVEYSGQDSDWLTVTPDKGINDGVVKVVATENKGTNRYATIFVTWSGGQERVNVSQNRPGDYLSVDKSSLSFSSEPQKPDTISIKSNTFWSIEMEEGVDWLSIDPSSGTFDKKVIVKALKNDTGKERVTTLYVRWSGGAEQIEVKQSNLNEQFEVKAPESLVLSNSKSSISFEVQYNVSWKVLIKDSDSKWLSANPNESKDASGSVNVELTAEENPDISPRETTIIFRQTSGALGKEYSYIVTQKGKATLKLKKDNAIIENDTISIKVAKTSLSFDVESNVEEWVPKTNADWLEIKEYTGGKDGKVTMEASFNNNNQDDRIATVSVQWINDLGTSVTSSFNIIQDRCPVVPAKLELEGLNASEGVESTIDDAVVLKIDTIGWDNRDKWLFNWEVANKEQSSTTNELTYKNLCEKKEYEVVVRINYEDDPENKALQRDRTFYLYPSPKSPTELVMKGNGSSGIMIAGVKGVSDAFLDSLGYKFVFGYDEKTVGTTSNRYWQYSNEIVKDNNVNKWVYTQWDVATRNNGNRTVKSKMRKNSDGVDTPTTRGATTAIKSLECGDIVLSDGRLMAELASPATAKISVASMSGAIVKIISLPASDRFDVPLDFSGLAPGIYVIRCNIGSLRTEKKIVIK